jgi:hypothetical protein
VPVGGLLSADLHARVAELLDEQVRCAEEWRDQVNAYFYRSPEYRTAQGRKSTDYGSRGSIAVAMRLTISHGGRSRRRASNSTSNTELVPTRSAPPCSRSAGRPVP